MNKLIVNDEVVPAETLLQLEKKYGVKCNPGNYWYDKMTGAFGKQGGPCIGIAVPGLQIGGELKPNASGGTTNVFINGRELHETDLLGLQTFVKVMPGRYRLDAYGNFGYEYSPAVGNLYLVCRSKVSNGKKSSATYRHNPWSGETISFGRDGEGFLYFASKSSDSEMMDYPIDDKIFFQRLHHDMYTAKR